MDVQAPARLSTGRTPRPTTAALVVTLATTAAAIGLFVSARGAGAGELLALFTALFLLRVAGQLVVLARKPAWLPPMRDWNLVPYPVLLPIQLVLLATMAAASAAVLEGWRAPPQASALVPFSLAYWGAMGLRYAVRMARRPEERWSGGTVPIVFHGVLGAFLFVLGSTASS
jgi:hypothetical protein